MPRPERQPIHPAATVIIARDARPQFEIFMLRRNHTAVFAGGMYVFPGGRVDPDDSSKDYEALLIGPATHQQQQKASLGPEWQQYWLAGIREAFEESGFMLAYDKEGKVLTIDARSQERFAEYRHLLYEKQLSLAAICHQEGLCLALDLIDFFNRWITPPGGPRRFDTRFFITQAPASQTGLHDGLETVDSLWISPGAALERAQGGELQLMAVTSRQLSACNQYQKLADFLKMAASNQDFPTYGRR